MNNRYHIQTYGCQMNVHESEKIAGILEARGFTSCDDVSDADIIVLNTCCVRETAETKVYGHLGRIKSQKKNGAILIVGGCMTQQDGAAERLAKRCPFVDIIVGTFNQSQIGEYIDEFLHTGSRVIDIWKSEKDGGAQGVHKSVAARTSGINAWVNIMYGCNNFCTYCIVPYVRGRERCRPIDEIIADVEALLKSGYKQITLLGQNVNSYKYQDKTFVDLLKMLEFDNKYRLKFMTSHPKDISLELAELFATSKVLSKNLHLPVQSGSDRILQAMNRHYTRDQYFQKISAFRALVPDIGLSSDVMVGFPTETEEDFLQTIDLVEKVRYNNLFMFIYSRRSGTPADKMPQLDYTTKQQRIDRLIKHQFEISKQIASEWVGRTVEVLISEKNGSKCFGKAQNDAAVSFESESANVGDFVNIKITSAKNANYKGEVVYE
ncbi:MAG: tRNA (N6-isopentenyl adenosine(37)-C2)-methylthiotransferase MiaB [Clostridiales bacterium]|nr:tRNA (N6-isopentenyl adenosine(37)-C2)-methylthiotransferase MiaB [Clostridiales bacterium]